MNSSTTAEIEAATPRWGQVLSWLIRNRQSLALPVMFLSALVIFSLGSERFLTADNLTNVGRQSVYLLIVSLGQFIVIVNGGLDLSVGSVVSLTSVVGSLVMAAVFAAFPDAPMLAIAAGFAMSVVIGTGAGVLNGLGVSFLRIPPFMMTLGMSSVLFGVTLFMSAGRPIYGMPPLLGEMFGFGRLGGFPVPVLAAIALVVIVYVVMEWTRFGRHIYAAGGNPRAAALSGVRTGRVTIAGFVLCGLLAAVSGFLLTARLGTGEANVGSSLPLESIAACVISGVALAGGQGRTFSVMIGTLLILLVQNGLNLMEVGAYAQTMATGAILIFAMAIARH